MKLIFASFNSHKVREIQNLLGPDHRVEGLTGLGYDENIPEPHLSLEENALEKARKIHQYFGRDCFADDTGLEVNALGGQPGVHSARYAAEMGPFSDEKECFRANIEKLLKNLKGSKNRRARFRTVIALIYDGKEYLFEGEIQGAILQKPRGKEGFGYDPVFLPENSDLSFAEMSLAEKNLVSHRARAFRRMADFLDSQQAGPQ